MIQSMKIIANSISPQAASKLHCWNENGIIIKNYELIFIE